MSPPGRLARTHRARAREQQSSPSRSASASKPSPAARRAAAPAAGEQQQAANVQAPQPAPAASDAEQLAGVFQQLLAIVQQIRDASAQNDENALQALCAAGPHVIALAVLILIDEQRMDLLVTLPEDATADDWNQSVSEAQYTEIIDQLAANDLASQEAYDGIWILYGNGDRRTPAAARTTFEKLYTARVLPAGSTAATFDVGQTLFQGNQWDRRWLYRPVNPSDATWKELMRGIRPLPQEHVNEADIAFVAESQFQVRQLTPPPPGNWQNLGRPDPIWTSYYLDGSDVIVIHADAQGNTPGSRSNVGQAADGEGVAVGGAGNGPALTFFLNHARHEVGHAVGVRQFAGMNQSGDDFARDYGGWAQSNRNALKAAPYWNSNLQARFQIDFNGRQHDFIGEDVADWLIGCIENQQEPAGNAVTITQGRTGDKIDGIAAAFPNEYLPGYVQAIWNAAGSRLDQTQNNGYMFPGFDPPADPIIWASRCNPPGWWQYSRATYQALHSRLGWYSLSSWREMFAEMYTHRYSGGDFPVAANGQDPRQFFQDLEASNDTGIMPSEAASGQPLAAGVALAPEPQPAATPLPSKGGG